MNKYITTVTLSNFGALLSPILELGEQDACGLTPPKLLANSDLRPMNTLLDTGPKTDFTELEMLFGLRTLSLQRTNFNPTS